MRWQKKLTKSELRHLRNNGSMTLKDFKKLITWQAEQDKESGLVSCFDCRNIAYKLGINPTEVV